MPYLIRKRDDKFYVINKGNGQTLSQHDNYKQAVKSVKARYANERKNEWPQWYR